MDHWERALAALPQLLTTLSFLGVGVISPQPPAPPIVPVLPVAMSSLPSALWNYKPNQILTLNTVLGSPERWEQDRQI